MKTSDIKVGVEYALADDYNWKRGKAQKVEVLAVRQERRVWREYSHGTAKDGVRVRRAETGNETVVRPAEIREPWAEYEPRAEAEAKARAESEAHADVRAEMMTERIRDLLPEGYDLDGLVPEKHRDGSRSYRPRISTFQDLALLLEAAATNALNQDRD